MRIVKLSTKDTLNEDDLVRYFDQTLPNENPAGRFIFPSGISRDGLAKGETVLFCYKGHVRYVAKTKSCRLDNTGKLRRHYPYYFVIDMASVTSVNVAISEIEKRLQRRAALKKSLKGQGWTRIEDSKEVAQVVESLIAEPISIALRSDDAGMPDEGDIEQYSPESIDRRPLVERQIRGRRGRASFRDSLRKRYGNRCMVTGCIVLDVLEAAHIRPYRGENDNHKANGLLLRADIHTLFDLDLMSIEPDRLEVQLHPDIVKDYKQFAGKTLTCDENKRPSRIALQGRYQQFRQKCGLSK